MGEGPAELWRGQLGADGAEAQAEEAWCIGGTAGGRPVAWAEVGSEGGNRAKLRARRTRVRRAQTPRP